MNEATGQVRPFFETLRELRGGVVLDELAFGLNEIVEAVRQTGKSGSLTLKLKIAPISKGDGAAVAVADDVVVKPPAPDNPATLFFSTSDNNLQRTNPAQADLPLRPVEDSAASKCPALSPAPAAGTDT